VVTRESIRIGFILASLNDLNILTADVAGAYLNAPCAEKVYTVLGEEFGDYAGRKAIIKMALYGLKSAGYSWRSFCARVLREELNFYPCRADNVWHRAAREENGNRYYEYLFIYTDDIIVISEKPRRILVNINKHFLLKKLKRQHIALRKLRDDFRGCSLPLNVIAKQEFTGELQRNHVDLLLSKFPPHMAKQAIISKDGEYESCPLHDAAWTAPRSIIIRMLELAPKAAQIQDNYGELPLHNAIRFPNPTAVELSTRAFPRGLFVTNTLLRNPINIAVCHKPKNHILISALINGLIVKLRNDASYTDLEKITVIISRLFFEKYDCSNVAEHASQLFQNFIMITLYEGNCDIRQMLIRFYCMILKTRDVIDVSSCLDMVFGYHLGANIFPMEVECKLLNIIESHQV